MEERFMDKELNEYVNAKKALVEKRLTLAKQLLETKSFAKHFTLYASDHYVVIYRINDYEDENKSLKYRVGPVTRVSSLFSEESFKKYFLNVLDSLSDKEKYGDINLFSENEE